MFKASINWLHGVLRLHVAEEMVAPRPDCAIPKMSSKVVRQHQNAGPKMRPFSEPSGNMLILRAPKTGPNSGSIFEAASHSFFEFSTPKKVITVSLFASGEAPCGAHVFEGFFGLENGPVKSDKSQEKTLFGKEMPEDASRHPKPTSYPQTRQDTVVRVFPMESSN